MPVRPPRLLKNARLAKGRTRPIKWKHKSALKTCSGCKTSYGSVSRIKRRQQEIDRMELAKLIQDEDRRVADLDTWVTSWIRAKQYRDFIATLEKAWTEAGHDVTAGTEKGKRLIWMREQADRLDPFIASPPSILDRRSELNRNRH